MESYDSLVKALRECYYRVSCNDCPIFDTCDGYIDRAMHDAADAIETLTRQVDNLERALRRDGEWQSTRN